MMSGKMIPMVMQDKRILIVYKIEDGMIKIIECKNHYDDK